ncbi:MAG: DUF4339 domain-containing protein [Thermoguttaceae bacterium]
MGIRFYCPNGHKMNVKEFQAGQYGVCPVCGAKMQIPYTSTRLSSKEMKFQPSGGGDAGASPLAAVDSSSRPSIGLPKSASLRVAAPDLPDPLAEAGNAMWYVRPAAGGQFGPFQAERMRTWLDERRIIADTLVWREGWRDWRLAGDVFPELSLKLAATGLELDDTASDTASVASPSYPLRDRSPRNPWILISVLSFLVVVLSGLLVWALLFR